MKRWFVMMLASAAAGVMMMGCVGQLSDSEVGHMSGALGEVEFSGTPEIREVEINRRNLEIDLRVHTENGTAMVGITIPHDGFDAEEMTFHPERAEMIGCSGRVDGEWEFDCVPDDFFVDIHDGKESLGLEFEGTWTGDDCHDLPDDAPDQPAGGYVDVDLI